MSAHGKKRLGIVVAGGPAPGINSVIGAATIRAILSGVEVLGIQDGFKWLAEGDISHAVPLTIGETSRIHFRGGSYIGISRANPTRPPEAFERTLDAMRRLGLSMLITIGGDGTATLARMIADRADWLRVVHVPKTIDNDIDLPRNTSTFGFQTARHIGVEIVKNLMVDAKTTSRWYLVVAQGRKAGHLALSIGKAAGATVTLIPEEFGNKVPLKEIVDTLAGSVVKRLAGGRPDGVAMLAEGLADCVSAEELQALGGVVPRDEAGRIMLAHVNLGDMLKTALELRLRGLGVKATIIAKSIGYEVRCADPIPFDMEYTRDLGYCAARFIVDGGRSAMVAMIEGRFQSYPLADLIDPRTGRMRVRLVDIESDRYKIARSYMLRLKREDFDDERELSKLAAVAHMTPERFRAEFGPLADREPAPMAFPVAEAEARIS